MKPVSHDTVLIGLFVCHWLADYSPLSTTNMLNAKKLGTPLLPIFTHALVHGALMGVFLLFALRADFNKIALLIILQVITHFLIDTMKGRMNSWFPELQNPGNSWHWVMFGFDQLLHAIVIIIMTSITV